MSVSLTVEEAQARLKELIHGLAPGDVIVIIENDRPIAKLIGERREVGPSTGPGPGFLKGAITYMAPDFDAPLDDMKEYME
jgi:antitoxin (DNA-binding transcriptional repressor) of toxin-antitoxin stability system